MSYKDHTIPKRTALVKSIYSQIIIYFLIILVLLPLTACSTTAIEEGSSFGNLPSTGKSIYLPDIITLGKDFEGTSGMVHPDLSAPLPSMDDLFISKIVKSDITMDFLLKGYDVTNDPRSSYDLSMTIYLFYQPDDWPLGHRTLHVRAEVSSPTGATLFEIETMRENWFGNLGDHLGFSGEEMMADTAEQIVNLTVDKHSSIQ